MADEVPRSGLSAKVPPNGWGVGSDDWERYDLPTLTAAQAALDVPQPEPLRVSLLARSMGVSDEESWKVGRATQRLTEKGLIDSSGIGFADGVDHYPSMIKRVRVSALEALQIWPTRESTARILVAILMSSAEELDATEPAEATARRGAAAVLERLLTAGITGFTSGLGGGLAGQP